MKIYQSVLLLVGVIFFGAGAVVLGVHFLEGKDTHLMALIGAAIAIAFGVFCWGLARIDASKRATWTYTRTGAFVHLIFAALIGVAIIFSVLVFPNPTRGQVFLSIVTAMILSMVVAEKILSRMGKPLIRINKE